MMLSTNKRVFLSLRSQDYYISPPTLYRNILLLILPPVCLHSQPAFCMDKIPPKKSVTKRG